MALPLYRSSDLAAARPARGAGRALAVVAGLIGVVVLVAVLALWFRYGTAVFFETVAAGIAGCF
jgi:type IV secretory pathway TrbD component